MNHWGQCHKTGGGRCRSLGRTERAHRSLENRQNAVSHRDHRLQFRKQEGSVLVSEGERSCRLTPSRVPDETTSACQSGVKPFVVAARSHAKDPEHPPCCTGLDAR